MEKHNLDTIQFLSKYNCNLMFAGSKTCLNMCSICFGDMVGFQHNQMRTFWHEGKYVFFCHRLLNK